MFGIWRMLLAVEVVAQHLLLAPFIGFYAVFSFFVLSGFLMTAIMHGTYGYSVAGFLRYLANRALRLYPSYWFAVTISLALIALIGADAIARQNPAMTMPQSIGQWVQNLSMIFANWMPKEELPRLVPLTWALTVEISFYILIGLGASRTRATTTVWLILSLIYVVVIRRLHPEGGGYLYETIPAGSLPFAVGALAWHYREALPKSVDPCLLIAARWGLYGAVLLLLSLTGAKWLVMAGNWINIALSAAIVCCLFRLRPTVLDRTIGDFSYPTYLLHMQMGIVASLFVTTEMAIFTVGLGLTIAAGAVSARLVDPAIERVRTRIKSVSAQ